MDEKEYISYIHGSEDSLDLDIYYVFDELPSFAECRKFCSENPKENRNIICIKDGKVTDCFIGTIDEINNSLIDTYNLHEQKYPLLITERVPRDITLKSIRAMRGILSLISHTQYRNVVKPALKANFSDRILALKKIDFTTIDFFGLEKGTNGKDALKVIAFQLGQTLGLYDNVELYTKSSIANKYPELKPFLYREDNVNLNTINIFVNKLTNILEKIETIENDRNCYFVMEKRTFDLIHENLVDNNEIKINGEDYER